MNKQVLRILEITSSFLVKRTNSLTPAKGMASIGSESVSSLTDNPTLLVCQEKGQ